MDPDVWKAIVTAFTHPVCSGLLGGLIGFCLGYWSTLWNNRRVEFNAIADPLGNKIHWQLSDPHTYRPVLGTESDALRRHFSGCKLAEYDAAIRGYQLAIENNNSENQDDFGDPSRVIAACRKLERFTKRR